MLFLAALLILLLPFAIYVAQNRQEIRNEAVDYFTFRPEAALNDSVYFDPGDIILTTATPVKIMANFPAKNVAFARVVFTFDTSKVQLASEITTSNLSTIVEKSPMNQINTSGRGVFVIASAPTDIVPTGNFELASFSIIPATGATNNPTTINFETADMQLVDKSGTVIAFNAGNLAINSQAVPTGGIIPSLTNTPELTLTPPVGGLPIDIPIITTDPAVPTTLPNQGEDENESENEDENKEVKKDNENNQKDEKGETDENKNGDKSGDDDSNNLTQAIKKKSGDFNNDGKVNLRDLREWLFSLFRRRFRGR